MSFGRWLERRQMNIQELYDEIDKQYDLYISEEGAGELPPVKAGGFH